MTSSHGLRSLALGLLLVALLTCGASCATAPQVGVRDAYSGTQVDKVAIAPLYSTSRFGLSSEAFASLIQMAETGAKEALQTYGYDVTDVEAFEAMLRDHDQMQAWRDGVLLRSELTNYFEPEDNNNPSTARTTLRKLYEAGALPSRYVLFGEIVYHTTTTCRVDPRDFHPLATLEGPSNTSLTGGQPCVVTHVRFKLVDARTADTMWYNEVLLESRTNDDVASVTQPNVYRAVDKTLGGSHGLPRTVPPVSANHPGEK